MLLFKGKFVPIPPENLFFIDPLLLTQVTYESAYQLHLEEEGGYFQSSRHALTQFAKLPLDKLLSFNLLDAFHLQLTEHLPKPQVRYLDGGSFFLRLERGTEKGGIKDLLQAMENKTADCFLTVDLPLLNRHYLLEENCITAITPQGQRGTRYSDSLEKRCKWLLMLMEDHQAQVKFNLTLTAPDKIIQCEKMFKTLKATLLDFKNRPQLSEDDLKALKVTIIQAMRKVAQLRVFRHGTTRLLHLYTNLLFHQFKIPAFYPHPKNLFDCKSDDETLRTIEQGQHQFQRRFGSLDRLITQISSSLNKSAQIPTLVERITQLTLNEHSSDRHRRRKQG